MVNKYTLQTYKKAFMPFYIIQIKISKFDNINCWQECQRNGSPNPFLVVVENFEKILALSG